ncbi:hypothetical protein ABD87_22625 [Lysinibacillus sphaericus]|uniref:type IA DNA topoisomerase n=1 Tax=Lysinibacillus sphaericus TaxID=1421 RepID=UPI0018CCA9B4|nr:type IA DNA topoisomerase [Lysinibacillus sphaericus]MBG9732222.1 hypothetical protein [Lysinibacillus sphaericus]
MVNCVLFAEKPSQARAYKKALGVEKEGTLETTLKKSSYLPHGAKLVCGIGHLVELAEPNLYDEKWKSWRVEDLPIFPEKFVLVPKKEHEKLLNHIVKLFKEADVIYHCGDIDREGDNVFGSILEYSGLNFHSKPIKRLWVNSLEKDVVLKGFENLREVDAIIPTFNEGRARQYSDWLIGMNLTRLYSQLVQNSDLVKTSGMDLGDNGKLTVGRCQSVCVAMVYQRQLEIENFRPKPLYDIEAEFTLMDSKSKFKGKAEYPKEFRENKERILDLLAHHQLNLGVNANGTIVSVEKKEKHTKPPKLHSLSSIQIEMNKKYKISPKETLTLIQSLYDMEYLSYPRTSVRVITDAEFDYIKEYAEKYKETLVELTGKSELAFQTVNDTPQKRYVNTEAVAEHFAIVTTRRIPTKTVFNSWNEGQQQVYLEVLRTVLGMFHGDYVYEETVITSQLNALMFKSKGKVEIDKGFKAMWFDESKSVDGKMNSSESSNKDDEGEEDNTQKLPFVSENEAVGGLVVMKEGKTTAPALLTLGELTQALTNAGTSKIIEVENEEDREILKETEGIGTEATRGDLIETIIKRKYVEVKSNRLHMTTKGKLLCKVLEGTLLVNPSMTAQWEAFLSKIGKGERDSQTFLDNIRKFILLQINTAPTRIKETTQIQTAIQDSMVDTSVGACPFCTGKIVELPSFYGCSGYKEGCEFKIWKKISGKRITQKQVMTLLKDGYTNKIKGFKKSKPSTNGNDTFDARLRINKEKRIVEFDFS